MERLRGAGCNVGEYTGDGQGEFVSAELHSVEEGTGDANPEAEHRELEDGDDDGDDNDDDDNDDDDDGIDHHPLLIFYDCEATGLSIYNDHLTLVQRLWPVPLHCGNQHFPVLSEPLDIF